MNEVSSQSGSVSEAVKSEAKSLHLLLEDMENGMPLWTREDLHEILRHQLRAPLSVDLSSMRGVDADRVERLAAVRGLVLSSFGDLLGHPTPPLELLKLTKEFAKRNLVSPDSRIPREVARVLYFACIAAADLRCGVRISTLPEEGIREGIAWCREREWLEPSVNSLLEEASA